MIFRGLFLEHNAEAGQKGHLWMDTNLVFHLMPEFQHQLDKTPKLGGNGGMKKRTITGLAILVFACAPLLLMASCAKEQVRVSEIPPPVTVQETEKMPEPDTSAEDAAREAELREAELREQRARTLAREVRLFESESIYFDYDKSDLKPEAKAILKKKADWLLSNTSYSVRIEGHCDERGTNEYNLALGQRRADSAKKFLAALGVSDGHIVTLSFGEEKPADPGHNEAAWTKNRRDSFQLIN